MVLVWVPLFRQNAHKATIILVIACHLYMFILLMLYFLVFTAVSDGLGKIHDIIFILVLVLVSVLYISKL